MNKLNRWVYAAVGVLVLFCAGIIYAWSVLSAPIAAEFTEWTKTQLSLTFTITMILFCMGCMAGGFLSAKLSPKLYVAAAAVLFLIGFQMTANIHSVAMLYIGFGVISGFGSGLVYNAVMGTITKWFPDKQGLISGVLLMGFGVSAFAIGKLYQALTPDEIGAWRNSFRFMGTVIPVVLVLCAPFFVKPQPTEATGSVQKKRAANPVAMEATTGQMIRKPAFWLYYIWAILLSAAGLALISQATGSASEVGPSVSAGTIATVVGLISIFNAVGRVLSGMLYDRLGRAATMNLVNTSFIVTSVILTLGLTTGSFALIVVGFITGGLSYGGVTPINSAFVSSYYGQKNFSMNFSVINTNLVIASFGSTIAGSLYDASRSYLSTYLLMAGLALGGFVITALIGMCDKRELAARKAR